MRHDNLIAALVIGLWMGVSHAWALEGTIEADSNFRPNPNGFSFPNYSNSDGISNLSSVEVHRMFGDQVCSNHVTTCPIDSGDPHCHTASITDENCVLTPQARSWMDKVNRDIGGGHCDGFATLSQLFYQNRLSPSDFGANSTFALTRSEMVQREIAYWWATQTTILHNAEKSAQVQKLRANAAITFLTNAWQPGALESYEMWLLATDADGKILGGHSVTPYAITALAGNEKRIYVYDNNYPNDTARYVTIDTVGGMVIDGALNSSGGNIALTAGADMTIRNDA